MKRIFGRCLVWLLLGIVDVAANATYFLGTVLGPIWPRVRYLRWFALPGVAFRRAETRPDAKSRRLAEELLQRANEDYRDDWYYGNAVHKAHIVLGRVALREGNLDQAKYHLLQAGRTPGSPQLASFGPNMSLARDLLKVGEREVVLMYFALCHEFWETGFDRLEWWTQQVQRGEIPDFRGNLIY